MIDFDDIWVGAQRRRYTRENAHLWIRHDAHRFMPPGAADAHQELERAGLAAADVKSQRDLQSKFAAERSELLELKALAAGLKWHLALYCFSRKALHPHHSLFQPRVPAGDPEGGQWTTDRVGNAADEPRPIISEPSVDREGDELAEFFAQELDDDGLAHVELVGVRDRSRGHHYVPTAVFEKYDLLPETYRVFANARTGLIPDSVLNYYDKMHRQYNDAVDARFRDYLAKNGIEPERMTPGQARDFLMRVIRSRDPDIRDLNGRIWRNIFRIAPKPRGGDS